MLIVLTALPDLASAEALARKIVTDKLAACVQILPQITSLYVWDGAVQDEKEILLLIKTLPKEWDLLERAIEENHPYEVPEIVAVNADKVSGKYLDWMRTVIDAGH